MTKALADRLAEAFAEYLHKRARQEWGFGKTESLTNEELIREKYRGIRPAAGYPACPDHTEKWSLWKLLDVTGRMYLAEPFFWKAYEHCPIADRPGRMREGYQTEFSPAAGAASPDQQMGFVDP